MENFGISASEAYDYIARGAQNGLDYSGELLDNISEYSVQFKKMGLSASDMFTIFSNGAENGAWNLDKIGDSVKELAIRVIDGSDTSKQGFEALGFEADNMAERFAAGGVSARVASGTLSFLLKNINLIASAVTGVTASVIAFKAANELTKVIASWQTAALQVTLLGNAQGAAAIKTAALSGELTAQEIIYGVLSGKLDIATAKTIALNTAMSMNPAGAIAAVVGILATAITGIALASANASESTEELNASAEELNQTAQGAVDAAQNVRKLVEEYKNIKTASDNTEEAKNRLKSIQDTLIETYDVEAEKLDLVNGKYENQLSILENIANQKTETARLAVNAAYYAEVDAQKKAFKIDNFTLGTNEVVVSTLSKSLSSIAQKYGSSFDSIKGEFKAGTSYETVEKILQEVLNENQEMCEEYINGRFSEEGKASGVWKSDVLQPRCRAVRYARHAR